jgi:MFS transporter, DHA1 family, tetracycline resistance protein
MIGSHATLDMGSLKLITRLRTMDRRLLTILMIVFVQMVGASMVSPILPLYAQSEFNLEPQAITLLLTAFFAAQFIAGPFIGRMSDQRGRLPVLIISQIGTVIAFIMIGVAESVEILFIARILDGITGGNIIVAQAYITDIMPEEKRTQALGYIFAAFGLGFIVGPALGGVLAGAFGPQVPFLIAAAAAFVTVLLTYFELEETVTPDMQSRNRDSKRASLKPMELITNVPLVSVLIVTFIAQFGFGMLIGVFALFCEAVIFVGYDESAINLAVGLLLAVFGVAQFITQIAILPRVLERYSDPIIVIIGLVLRSVSMVFYAVALGPIFAAIGSILFALGSGLMMPPLQSITTKTVASELRGGILGIYQSVISLAVIFSTGISGVIFAVDPIAPFWITVGLFSLALVPAVFLWNWSRTHQKAKNEKFVSRRL